MAYCFQEDPKNLDQMLESGFTSCEDEMLENVTASLVSSYTDGATWKSSSSSSVESLTKCEELELDEERSKPSDGSLMKGKTLSPLKHKPVGWNDSNRTPYVEEKQWRWNVDNATPCSEHKSRSWHDPDLTTCVEENRGWEDGDITPCVEHKPWGWKDPDATPCVERRSRWEDGDRTPCVEHKSDVWEDQNRVYNVSNKARWDHVDTPCPDHKPPRWEDAGRWAEPATRPKSLLRVDPDSLSLSPRTGGEIRSFRRSGIPVVQTPQPQPSTPLPSKLLTKCQSLQDLSKCLAMIHTDRLNNTYNSTDTINSQSLSSTKDSGFQRSYSSNSICSVRRRNKYEHVESKVKQYIRNIKDNERKHKALKRNSMNETELDTPTSRGSFQEELFAENVSGSGGSKSCCNTRRSSYQDELRVLFNIDDESNRALTTLIKKLEVEKFERDLLIENLQVKYHELNNKLTSANETISDLKNQVTVSPLATSAQCADETSTKPRNSHTRRYSERSYQQHHMKRRLSPVHSQSSQASRHQSCTDTKGPPQEPAPCCSSRSSQNSSRLNKGHVPNQPPHPPSRKKLNLPREDPFLKVKRWQDSLTGVDTSSDSAPGVSYPDPITSSPSDSGPGVSYPPAVTSSPLQKSSTLASLPPSPITPPQSSHTPKTPRTFFKAFDSSFHLGRSKTSPDIKRSTVYINIGDHSSKKIKQSSTVVDENSNLCPPATESSTPPPKKQITVLKIYEAEDGTKVVQDVSKRRGATSRQQSVESNGTTKIEVNQTSSPRPGTSSPQCIPVSPLDVNSNPDSGLPPSSPLTKQSQSSMKSYGLSQSKTTPNMKRVSINLSTDIRSSTTDSSDSLNTTTEDELPGGLTKRPPSVPPNTRLFKELSSLKSCLNEVDEQIHVLKHGIDNLIKSSSQKSIPNYIQQP